MTTYESIVASKSHKKELFKFTIDGQRFELPRVSDLPMQVKASMLVVAQQGKKKGGAQALSILFDYLQRRHEDLWELLEEKDAEGEDYLGVEDDAFHSGRGLLAAWFKASDLDPKASR